MAAAAAAAAAGASSAAAAASSATGSSASAAAAAASAAGKYYLFVKIRSPPSYRCLNCFLALHLTMALSCTAVLSYKVDECILLKDLVDHS